MTAAVISKICFKNFTKTGKHSSRKRTAYLLTYPVVSHVSGVSAHPCRITILFLTPTANAESWAVEAFSLCVLLLPKSPSGPPWNEGHRPKARHETSVLEVPAQEQHEHSFYSSSTNTFITGSLYTVRGYRTSPGAPDLRARLGWLQGSTRNGMSWGALALLEIPLSRGCCLKCTVLPVQGGVVTYSTEC